ncbi:hypothetical protein ACHAXA_010261 [Cyclostephanos tholiformis]|uniref:Uncharacterized protein n=1 Tax=Cyclostephanos tholiformis TaxID=382380 RepID=A0ABD3RTR3_9STRA
MPSKKNRNRGGDNKGGRMNANTAAARTSISAAAPLFSIDAALSEAKHQAVKYSANDRPPTYTTTTVNDENALPNNLDGGSFLLLPPGKPRRSFVDSKSASTNTPTPVVPGSLVAGTGVASASAAPIAEIPPVVDSSDDDYDDDGDGVVEDIIGVSDANDGNSLESLSPSPSTPSRGRSPASSTGGSGVSSEKGPIAGATTSGPSVPSEMKYSTVLTSTSLYNLMGGPSDAALITPRTLELSNALESLSFNFPSPEGGVRCDGTTSSGGDVTKHEDDAMPSSAEDAVVVPAATTTTAETTTFDVAQAMYGFVKDAWAGGKHVPVVSNLLDVAETVAANLLDSLIESTTSDAVEISREMVLFDIDERVMKPRMKKLDEVIISPTIVEVWRVIELVVRVADEMVIRPIATGPLGAVFAERNEKNDDVELL